MTERDRDRDRERRGEEGDRGVKEKRERDKREEKERGGSYSLETLIGIYYLIIAITFLLRNRCHMLNIYFPFVLCSVYIELSIDIADSSLR